MEYLVYMSTAVNPLTDSELKDILVKSQLNNSKNNLTGILLYSEGTFVQVLEGEVAELDETFEKILNDTRHKGVIELVREEINERSFPDWSMGFRTLSPAEFSEFKAYIGAPDSNALIYGTHPALAILKTFAKTNFHN
jgi:hypothetical protein